VRSGAAMRVTRALVFFLSSRRRHTRLVSDWSSDVCSSDLDACVPPPNGVLAWWTGDGVFTDSQGKNPLVPQALDGGAVTFDAGEVGRASCRERGEGPGGAEAVETRRAGEERGGGRPRQTRG